MKVERKNKQEFRVEVPKYVGQTIDLPGMANWCKQMFGDDGRNRRYHWRYGWIHPRTYQRSNMDVELLYYFYFRREQDAAYFVLNWAG